MEGLKQQTGQIGGDAIGAVSEYRQGEHSQLVEVQATVIRFTNPKCKE